MRNGWHSSSGVEKLADNGSLTRVLQSMERSMDLAKLRESYEQKLRDHEETVRALDDKGVRHFRQEGDGPLADVSEAIKAEYHRHIETYAALIAEIDAILGV
jgi:hypothetical protein